jgi:hypothetical protein
MKGSSLSNSSLLPPCSLPPSLAYKLTSASPPALSTTPPAAGSFLSGSLRWRTVSGNHVRFDAVTYWSRDFSPFVGTDTDGKFRVGDNVKVSAQQTGTKMHGRTDAKNKHKKGKLHLAVVLTPMHLCSLKRLARPFVDALHAISVSDHLSLHLCASLR